MKRQKKEIGTSGIRRLDEGDLANATGGLMTKAWCQKAASFEFWVSYHAMNCERFE